MNGWVVLEQMVSPQWKTVFLFVQLIDVTTSARRNTVDETRYGAVKKEQLS